VTLTPFICNAAAIARGDCKAPPAVIVPPPVTSPYVCNGGCKATTLVVAPPATTPFICNAAAIARGDCYITPAISPNATATSPPVQYTGAAGANKLGSGLMAAAFVAALL